MSKTVLVGRRALDDDREKRRGRRLRRAATTCCDQGRYGENGGAGLHVFGFSRTGVYPVGQ